MFDHTSEKVYIHLSLGLRQGPDSFIYCTSLLFGVVKPTPPEMELGSRGKTSSWDFRTLNSDSGESNGRDRTHSGVFVC